MAINFLKCTTKDTVARIKRKPTEWGIIFVCFPLDKR
jgi:hypothetical protein